MVEDGAVLAVATPALSTAALTIAPSRSARVPDTKRLKRAESSLVEFRCNPMVGV